MGRSSGEAGILLHPSGWTILHRHMEFSENTPKVTLKQFINEYLNRILHKDLLSPKIDKGDAEKSAMKGYIPYTDVKL